AATADDSSVLQDPEAAALLSATLEAAETGQAAVLPSFGDVFANFKEDTSNATARQQLGIMLQSLPVEDLEKARDLIASLPPGAARDQFTLQLTERWAELDPYGALEYAQSLPTLQLSQSATNRALTGWAKTDPQSALAWWNSEGNQATGRISNQRFEAIMEGFAQLDGFSAFDYAAGLPEDSLEARRLKNRALESVVESMIEQGQLNNALTWAEQMPPGEGQTTALAEILEEWASYDPDAAVAYLSELSGRDDYPALRQSMLRTWARSDPEQAAAYLSEVDADDPDRGNLTTMLIAQWSRYDITGPGEWLNEQPPSPEIDRAVAIFTFRAASEDPAGAMSWAQSITEEGMSSRMMGRVASEWKAQDPEAFATFMEEADLTIKQREDLENAQPSSGRRGGPWWR
ncbi:MAG: hypothetical protein AAGF10_05950, partial [Verrucomicrobiota bacterium]